MTERTVLGKPHVVQGCLMDRRILCTVLDDDIPTHEAASFRLLEEVGGSFFLDFLNICPLTSQAAVVVRLRMPREALAAVRDRLLHDVVEFRPEMVN